MVEESRRNFLKKFNFFKKEKISINSNSSSSDIQEINRRDFLKFIGLLSLNLAPSFSYASEKKEMKKDLKKLENEDINDSYSKTLTENFFVIFSKIISEILLKKLGIEKVGHASEKELKKKLSEKPIEIMVEALIATPILEELIFRYFPNLFLVDNKQNVWEVGIPTSLIFAYIHNYKHFNDEEESYFDKEYIPLPQFIGGCFYWYLIRQRGLSHSILAHASHNVVGLVRLSLKEYK